jgi:hypothetical protein
MEDDGVAGSRTARGRLCHRLGEDDDVVGLGMAQGQRHHGLKNGAGSTTSQTQGGR